MRTALVLGGGNCVWDDVAAALDLGEFDGVLACNDVGAVWPGDLDAWVSLHTDKMGVWTERRAKAGHAPALAIYGQAQTRGRDAPRADHTVEFKFPGQSHTGSSGLFALKVALIDLGFDKAVLCGVPMHADERHFFDIRPWRGALSHRQGWKEALPVIRDQARSMSGWTREILGAPDEEWLGQ